MSETTDWEMKQLKRLIAAILKKVGPVTITSEALNKSKGEWRVVEDGFGIMTGHKYFVK